MKTIFVPDMMCAHCVQRITDALNAAKIQCRVSLENKTVEIEEAGENLNTAVSELEDLGFTPEIH